MKYTKLGKSDLTVSRICMGCMGFGAAGEGQHSWTLDEEHSREIISREQQKRWNWSLKRMKSVIWKSRMYLMHWQESWHRTDICHRFQNGD